MPKNKVLVSCAILFIMVPYYFFLINEKSNSPIPIEFIQKKNDRKIIKENRQKWIFDMHKAHPDVNWQEIDHKNRKINTDAARESRRSLINNGNIENISDNYEIILERDIEGTWVEKGSNNLAGRIRTADIDFNNNTIYCASSGGNVWKGTIDGENWTSLNDYMQIPGVTFLRVIDTGVGQRLLIGSENNGFYFSDNECLSLIQSNGLGNNYIKRFIIQNGTNHIFALVNDSPRAVYRSTNLGESFELLISLDSNVLSAGSMYLDINYFDIFTPRYFDDKIYLMHGYDLYEFYGDNNELEFISNHSGTNQGGLGFSPNDVVLTGGVSNNGTFLYAYAGEHIFKSINGGVSWSHQGVAPSSWWWINGFNASNLERDKVFIGGMELFKSLNGGNHWELVNPWWEYYNDIETQLHADIPEIRFFLDQEYNEVALISTDGGLYISDDYLESVENISMSGLGVSQYYSTYSQRSYPYSIFAGSQDQGLQKSITNNEEIQDFEQIISGDYGHLVSGDEGNSVWANYPGFTIYYPDIANSNASISLDFPGDGYLWIAPLMEHPISHDKVILGGGSITGGNRLIELSVQNNELIYSEQPFTFFGTVSAMSYSPLNISYRYVLTDNGAFYYSVDGGDSWTATSSFNGPTSHYFYGSTIWASRDNVETVYIGGSGYSNPAVYVSYDHGQTFSAMDNGLPNTLVFQLAGTPEDAILFAATEIGPYGYSVNEDEWFLLSGISAPDQTYWTVDYIQEINTARFGTYGRGIWDFVLNVDYNINYGDVNQDNNINIQDIIIIIGYIIEQDTPNNNEFLISDINQDGIINVLDIVLIVDIIFN